MSSTQQIKLQGFVHQNKIYLNWSLQGEFVHSIQLQRSEDGKQFEKIADINVQWNTQYSYIDEFPLEEMNHYRLQVEERNGTVFHTNPTSIDNQRKAFAVKLYPNPALKEVYVQLPDEACNEAHRVTVKVFDGMGRPVIIRKIRPKTIRFEFHEVRELSPGMYRVQYWLNDQMMQASSFIKQ